MIFGVDVDLTVVDSDLWWAAWLAEKEGAQAIDLSLPEVRYNLSEVSHPEASPELRDELYKFWRYRHLYDHMEPKKGAVEALREIKALGHEIVFISHIKGDHHKSKVKFLKKHFGDVMDGFIATQEKQFARCDVLIDDRVNNLNSLCGDTQGVLFKTNYTQTEEPVKGFVTLESWEDYRIMLDAIAKPKDH